MYVLDLVSYDDCALVLITLCYYIYYYCVEAKANNRLQGIQALKCWNTTRSKTYMHETYMVAAMCMQRNVNRRSIRNLLRKNTREIVC